MTIEGVHLGRYLNMRHACTFVTITLWLLIPSGGLLSQNLQPFTCNGDFYNVFARTTEFQSNPSVLARVTIDPNNQVEFTELGRLPAEVNGIGYRVTDNLIYGMTQDDNTLIRIDSRGRVQPLRVLSELNPRSYFAADVTPDGNFLVMLGNDQNSINPQPTNSLVFVDLRDQGYPTDSRTLNGSAFFPDLAFDPFEDQVAYAYDGNTRQLHRIDVSSGTSVAVGRGGQPARQMTSLYFDPLGRLYGYGIVGNFPVGEYFLFAIDKNSGTMRALAEGPEANKNDGCSCPYRVTLQENVQPRLSVTCTPLRLVYTIGNATGQLRTGLTLSEDLPAGLSVTQLIQNPFGGNVSTADGQIRITDMAVPIGVDSIVFEITSSVDGAGIHRLQSTVSGLPLALGRSVVSDDPLTFSIPNDRTQIEIRELSSDYSGGGMQLCPNDTLVFVFDTIAGANYTVNDQPFDGVYRVTEAGNYIFRASSGCTNLENGITVVAVPPPEIELPPGSEIELGDSIQIVPFDIVGVDPLMYNWSALFGDPTINCPTCAEPFVRPLVTTLYQLDFSDGNGCIVSDTIQIRVDSEIYFYAPNAFSPNGDGINDRFRLLSSRPYQLKVFSILDRWGNILFREENTRMDNLMGWDGVVKGTPLNPGVYIWMAIFDLPDGSEVPMAGDINLIR
ncbi:MAG: gliding motility-associated C-terminal domain-containing protein [Saprospiraceae bacterium]|nr:gliding motility-associated C-terminal domain-containing protein [Saprospiraceae bacterium]